MALPGKVAIIVGGCSSIGRATALRFAREGARVVVADRDRERGGAVVESILDAGGDATFSEVDVTDETSIQSMVADAIVAYGTIHAVVNTASCRIEGDALSLDPDAWRKSLAVNLESSWLCARYAAPFLKSAGGGSLVHVASTHALRTMPRQFAYATTKGALLPMSRALAIDLGPQSIRSNVIIPGHITSDHTERRIASSQDPETAFRRVLAVHPLGRVGVPEDVAGMAHFLVSDDAAFVTGAAFLVDGGRSAVIQELYDWA
jgi:glucose 1-dehydrogenase